MKILLLGCGAIGSNLALNLANDTNEEICIVDKDEVEARNIQAGTQFYTREQIGKTKVDALALNIFIATGKRLITLNGEIGESELDFLDNMDLVVDGFDNYRSRELVTDYCKDKNISCIHIGFSPQLTFAVEWNSNYKVPEDTKGFDVCEAQGAASFVRMVVAIASLNIQHYLKTNEKLDLVGNFKSVTTVA